MNRKYRHLVGTLALLLSTLACRAATSLIFPDTPTPLPPATLTPLPNTPIPTLPAPTEEIILEAACPLLLSDIMDAALSDANSSEKFSEEDYYVLYTIDDDKLKTREDVVASNNIGGEYDSRAKHESLWNYFAEIIPEDERKFVTKFAVTSDGRGEILAAVSPNYDNPSEWTLEVDTLDTDDNFSLTYTLMHEFGHLLTLNSKQVPVNRRVLYNIDDIDIYEQAVAQCPQYFTGEGCSTIDSYINEFFKRFWSHFYEEWQEVDEIDDEDVYYDRLDDFHDTYQDQFLTDYAPTSPAEDIAESWSFFVLSPKPDNNSIANEKILFFYEYPELVRLRGDILNRVCEAFPE
ncbi:MAG TPA: hypothetical protein DCX53_05120 [Anaerolineae bacterium]|nr:hypothetical protein [Anaerolineae bacterium]